MKILTSSISEYVMCEIKVYLLPSGSEQHKVLQVGSIQEGILQAGHQIVQIENTH